MSSTGAVVQRYARGLTHYGKEAGGLAQGLRELEQVQSLIESDSAARLGLTTALLRRPRRIALMKRIAAELKLSEPMGRFLEFLLSHDRMALLPDVLQETQKMLDGAAGVVRARVESARDLSEGQRNGVAQALSQTFGKKALCTFQVNEALIAGVRARVGNVVLDGSTAGRLEELSQRLRGSVSGNG